MRRAPVACSCTGLGSMAANGAQERACQSRDATRYYILIAARKAAQHQAGTFDS
eukprot:m.18268 g.18268  ORF g.18268 m.18268 type:complete len:54 (+) comp5290_c0_seq1:2851-3012(+)